MIVADSQDGGIGQNGFAHDDADIDADLTDASVGYTYLLDEAVVLIHQQNPELFYVLVLQYGVHVVVDACSRPDIRPFLDSLQLTALAKFASSQNGDGLGWSHTVILTKVVDGELAQGVQIVVAIVQDMLH